jgi:hypothetical protein
MSSNTQKLRVLRSRTDHDLLTLVHRNLDRGLSLAEVATSQQSPLFAQAGKSLATALLLLPRISGLSEDERLQIETRARDLRLKLEKTPVYANARSYVASVAS